MGNNDSKFELVSKYKPTGDQPQAIEKLVKGVEKGVRSQVLMGGYRQRENVHHGECNCSDTKADIGFSA